MVYNWLDSIQSRLFPPVCVLCGGAGSAGRDLCHACLLDLPLNTSHCGICANSLPRAAAGTRCGDCQRRPPPFTRIVAPYIYGPPLDHLILGLKFNGRLAHARLLGELLAMHLRTHTDFTAPDCLLPVPLHRQRLRERGFNQATEIARTLARRLDLPLDAHSCQRIRTTTAQSALPLADRRRNLRQAFSIRRPLPARYVVIVDDVVTSGSTVTEMSQTLLANGVQRVDVWAVARA